MDRRAFIQTTVAALLTPVLPAVLPEPVLPTPMFRRVIGRAELRDIYISREALEDIRNWGVDQIDETTRREIMVGFDNGGS